MYDKVITDDQFKQAREQSDDVWDDSEVFFEERDRYPLRELVLTAVEGEFTHPAGNHTVHTLEDSIEGLTNDYVNDAVPDSIPEDVRQDFQRDVAEEVRENAKELYKATRDDADEYDSISALQDYLESTADDLGISETA